MRRLRHWQPRVRVLRYSDGNWKLVSGEQGLKTFFGWPAADIAIVKITRSGLVVLAISHPSPAFIRRVPVPVKFYATSRASKASRDQAFLAPPTGCLRRECSFIRFKRGVELMLRSQNNRRERQGKPPVPKFARGRRLWSFYLTSGLTLGALCSPAQALNDDRWGWHYCPPPYPPRCVERSTDEKSTDQYCAKVVQTYVASVFAYRACQAKELERAITEANRIINVLKCRSDKKYCGLIKDDNGAAAD
jgi:hypothetical protein